MSKKTTILIIVIGIVCITLLYFLQSKEPKDEVTLFMEEIQQTTGIGFSEIQESEFKWVISVDPETEEMTIQGKEFEATKITGEQYNNLEAFLENKGFSKDIYNLAAGTVSGLTGYKQNGLVCTVSGGATGYKEAVGQWIPPDPGKYDITVKCGKR